jgi:hypothetical protein
MAHQAVNAARVVEIKVRVLPPVADVAPGAGWPVRLDADAEIIDEVALADAQRSCVPGHQDLFTLPVPVRRCHDFGSGIRVAFEAGPGYRWAVRERGLEEAAVVGVQGVLRKPGVRTVALGWLRLACAGHTAGQQRQQQ